MRTLRFIVDDQIIKQDPNCDFTNLVPGTNGYLKAHFSFSPAWDGCVKAVAFSSMLGTEYDPQVLRDGKTCAIPSSALKKQAFRIRVIGRKGDFRITTNNVTVTQDGGKA